MLTIKTLTVAVILLIVTNANSQILFGIDVSRTDSTEGWTKEKEYKKKSDIYSKSNIGIWDKVYLIEEEGFVFTSKEKNNLLHSIAYKELEYYLGSPTKDKSWYGINGMFKDKTQLEQNILEGNAFLLNIWETTNSTISLLYDSKSLQVTVKIK